MKATALLLATRNPGKVRELRPIFARAGWSVSDLDDLELPEEEEEEFLEQHATFEENALAKARFFYEASGGIPTVADDSGLVVDALGGAPGVHSKRFNNAAGLRGQALDDANSEKLLAMLRGHGNRTARYVCAAAFAGLGQEHVTLGETVGAIVDSARGKFGFGYDPYFESSELGKTFGEATTEEKEAVSHRGRAFRALIAAIRRSG